MLYSRSPIFNHLLDEIQALPVIDCHEHMMGPDSQPSYKEPIAALTQGYILSDLEAGSFGLPLREFQRLSDPDVSTDEKWPAFEKLWRSTEHTAYARVSKLVLQNVYGERQMTRASLDHVEAKLANMDENAYFRTIDQANIQAMVVDVFGWLPDELERFLEGKKTYPPKWRPVISLPSFHGVKFSWESIEYCRKLTNQNITSLDEYLEAVFKIFQRCMEKGVVGIKDQSAYERVLAYDLVPKSDAERQFNLLLTDPRNILGWPEGKLLNDYLFHQYMRFARELKLPVQLHTGHMAGIYNRVDKANAVHLASVLELHRDVRFDLFHGNWPYMGDLLFLGKNYPNVFLDLCWVHIIDPIYTIKLLERAVLTIPHSKIHGFGGDYTDCPEYVAAHLQLARQNIATALSNLVEGCWLEEEQALALAKDWLFNNPNRFFNLGFEEI